MTMMHTDRKARLAETPADEHDRLRAQRDRIARMFGHKTSAETPKGVATILDSPACLGHSMPIPVSDQKRCPSCGGVMTKEPDGVIEEPVMTGHGKIERRARPAAFFACGACEHCEEVTRG